MVQQHRPRHDTEAISFYSGEPHGAAGLWESLAGCPWEKTPLFPPGYLIMEPAAVPLVQAEL